MKGFIFDLKREGENKIKIVVKDGKRKIVLDEFDPYFYLIVKNLKVKKDIESMPEIKKIETVEKFEGKKKIKLLKIFTKEPGLVIKLRKDLAEVGEPREADIPYVFRYLIDKDLYPMKYYDISLKDIKVEKFKESASQQDIKLSSCAFDIEVYNKSGIIADPKKDKILMISYVDEKEQTVFHWTKKKGSEKEVILDFLNKVEKRNPDVIIGYNSSGFDIPYLKKRCSELEIDLELSIDKSPVFIKKGAFSAKADMFGRLHLDDYNGVSFLSSIGAMSIPKNDLESVYKEMIGKEKIDIDCAILWKMWESGGKELETLIQYNKEDAIAAFEIGQEILPLYIELSKIIGLPPYEISRMSTSQMVEWLLIREAGRRNIIVPKQPREETVKKRMMNPIKGALVKLPKSGLHENIVVCDFRSLYPSLIMTYNIDGTTLNCNCCKNPNVSPLGHKFCKKEQGIVPKMIKELVEARRKIKDEMKKYKRGTTKYKSYHYRQWSQKIIANSAYGYLGYGRAKWYSREAAESITAWARQYLTDLIDAAEKAGFEVLYGDTDGIFLKLNNKKEEDKTKKFIEKINKGLPKDMELEFEGFYPRGIFVTRKEGTAAKKRYALIRDDGTIEIKGFELVRRDWSNIAKETQQKVIEAVLREGKPEKAVADVKKAIQNLRERKVNLDDLIIYTQIKRKLSSYAQQAPHVKAAKKLEKAGYKIKAGTLLEFVIITGPGSISDRAIPIQLLGNKKYDSEYYIENQVLPAVMKILRELGIKEEDLKYKGKQTRLGGF